MTSIKWDFNSVKIDFQMQQTVVELDGIDEPLVIREMAPAELIDNLLDIVLAVAPDAKRAERYLGDLRTHMSKYFFDRELFHAWASNIAHPDRMAKVIQFKKPQSPAKK